MIGTRQGGKIRRNSPGYGRPVNRLVVFPAHKNASGLLEQHAEAFDHSQMNSNVSGTRVAQPNQKNNTRHAEAAVIDQRTIDAANATDLVDLIRSRGVALTGSGNEFKGLCPFHDEKSPSFTVNTTKRFYHCFGCGAHGDAIDFVQEHDDVTFHEAIHALVGGVRSLGSAPHKRQVECAEPVEEWCPITPVPDDADQAVPSVFHRRNGAEWQKLESKRRWAYLDAAGRLLGYIHRFEWTKTGGSIAKDCIPQSYCVNTQTGEVRWKWLSFAKPRPIYGLDKLAQNLKASVIVVEGEKACDAAQERFIAAGLPLEKLVVVSWPGGGKGVKHVDWSPLYGRKVGLWPDADQKRFLEDHPRAGRLLPFLAQPGTVAMLDVFVRVKEHCRKVKFFLPRSVGLADGWDLADELPSRFDLRAHIAGTHAMNAADMQDRFSLTSSIISTADRILPVWLVPPTDPADIRRAAFAADVVTMFDETRFKQIDPRGVVFRSYDGIDGLRDALAEVGRLMPSARIHAIIPAGIEADAAKIDGFSKEVLPSGESWVDVLWAKVTAQTGLQEPAMAAKADTDPAACEVAKQSRAGPVAEAQMPGIEVKSPGTFPAAYASREIPLAILQQIDPPENSDDALAMQFVECAANFRWSPGLGWMIDNSVTWSRDDAMHRFDLARQVCRTVAAACSVKSESEAKRIASAKTVNATVTLAQSDRRMVVPTYEWDAAPLLLNTPGGVVDLRTGKMRERGIEYVTQAAAVAPDFSAECPTWKRFMQQVFLDDTSMIEFMQRSMGYWLSGSVREQVIHFLHGQGSNGKSVLSDLVKWIVGSYGVKLSATALMQSKGERHPTELAQLRGKRLALSSELGENDFFNEALLKELTGDATLSARFMRGDFFEFQMSQKHLIVGNFKPRLRGGDPAIARRMLLVPFNATFKGDAKDMGLLDKLKAEAPAILAWMIYGANKWHAEGLAIPESVRAASAEYMADHDDVAQWISECCELKGEAKAGDLYASFSAWKKGRGENPPSQTVWGSRLSALSGISKRRSGGIRYSGIQLIATQFGSYPEIGPYADIRD